MKDILLTTLATCLTCINFSLNKSTFSSPLLSVITGRDTEEDYGVKLNESALSNYETPISSFESMRQNGKMMKDLMAPRKTQEEKLDPYLQSRTDMNITASTPSSVNSSPVIQPRRLKHIHQIPSCFPQC